MILIYFPCKTGLETYSTPLVVNRGRVGTTIHFAMYVGLLQMSIGTQYFTQLTKARDSRTFTNYESPYTLTVISNNPLQPLLLSFLSEMYLTLIIIMHIFNQHEHLCVFFWIMGHTESGSHSKITNTPIITYKRLRHKSLSSFFYSTGNMK